MIHLQGCGTALLTPFKDGAVDLAAFAASVDRQVAAGIHFLVPLGSTGETPCLSDEEKVAVLRTTRAHSGGRPVIAGGGSNSLQGTLRSMALLAPHGVDAFLIVVPYYNKPTQQGLYEYFKAVAAATDKDIVIYNVPSRTGTNLSAETTLRLAREVPNITAIKEASGNGRQVGEILAGRPEGFSVLSGNDDDTLALMAAGADGVISVASNVAPAEMVRYVEALLAGDLATARPLHFRLMPLFRNLFLESNPIPAKAAMARLGLMDNSLRLPLTPASENTEKIIAQTLAQLWK